MRVHMIHAALGIILCHENCGILPQRQFCQERQDSSKREVIIRDIGGPIRIAVCGSGIRRVIVGQSNYYEAGNFLRRHSSPEIPFEFIDPDLVWNPQIEGWKGSVSRLEYGSRDWSIQQQALTLRLYTCPFVVSLNFKPLSIIKDAWSFLSSSGDMLPQ
jgi:hypothetical protein